MYHSGVKHLALLLAAALLLLAIPVQAATPDKIVSNSADWRDVYSVMLYGSLLGRAATFLVSERHAPLMAESFSPNSHIWVISSKTAAFTKGYGNYLNGQGFTTESFEYDNVNLELAKKLNTTSFVIVDDAYGYNAISVAPYAVVSNSFVLFANAKNIDQVDAFLTTRSPTKVLIYGHVERTVKSTLAKYNPETINIEGDRFANNIEIVKRYQKIAGTQQVILTNGEFIEAEIMSGKEPVIFIGRNNVPDIVRSYIKGSKINVGVLIGNELVNTATFIRRDIGISVFVKFARSARSTNSAVAQVEALDTFYLPVYSLNLVLDSISYNSATGQLEVVLHNTKDQAAYFKGTYTITSPDGTKIIVGDSEPVFIEPNSYKTVTYLVDNFADESTIGAYIIYGESKNSLEYVINEQYCISCQNKISKIDVIDKCNLNMTSLTYNLPRKLFYAEVQNTAPVECYANIQLIDVLVAAEKTTYHLSDVALLQPGETKVLRIKGQLEKEDLQDNPFINVEMFYGQRQNNLIKKFSGKFALLISTSAFSLATTISYGLLAVIILISAMIVWRIFAAGRRRRKKEKPQ